MLTKTIKPLRVALLCSVLSIFALSMTFAQDAPADPAQNPPPTAPAQNPSPAAPGWHRFSAPPPPPATPPEAPAPQAEPAPVAVPNHITIPAGTFVTVRVDQFLSSDKNKAGDAFAATLSRPLVADGLVVARRGEMLGGHVVDAKKAGRVKGVSHLQITLNSLTLADGQQVPVETALTSITGTTSNGRDAGGDCGDHGRGRSHWGRRSLGSGRGHRRRSRVGCEHGGCAGDARASDRHLSGGAVDLPARQARHFLDREGAAGFCRCQYPQYSACCHAGASAGSAAGWISGRTLSTAVLLRRTRITPIPTPTLTFGDRALGSFTGAGSMAEASDSDVKVCPLLSC